MIHTVVPGCRELGSVPPPLSGTRRIVGYVFAYTGNTDYTEKYFVRRDVTDNFPFLVSKVAVF